MSYISRLPVTPDYVSKQLVQSNTNRQNQKETEPAPVMEVAMVDDAVRHPVTQQWTRQYQNSQHINQGKSMDKKAKGDAG